MGDGRETGIAIHGHRPHDRHWAHDEHRCLFSLLSAQYEVRDTRRVRWCVGIERFVVNQRYSML